MKLRIDKEADAIYFRLVESAIVESEEVQPGVIRDYDAQNRVVGVEFPSVSRRVASDELRSFQFESNLT